MLKYILSIILVNKVSGSMKCSTRGRYGIRALSHLVLQWDKGLIQLKDISRRQRIPLQYLEQLITPLIAAGIVRSTRGARGGVSLVKPPQEIKLQEVFQCLEGPIAPLDCVDNPESCPRSHFCATRDIWVDVKKAVVEVLEFTTLQDLAEQQEKEECMEQEVSQLNTL